MRYVPGMNRFGKNVLVTGGTTLFSRLLGCVRDAAMAWLIGAGPVADALSVALRLPWGARRLLGEGSLSLGLSVACTSHADPCGLALAVGRKLFRPAVGLLCVLLLCAPWLVDALAPGASEDVRREATVLLRLSLPYLLFAGGAACCMAGMHARGRFALSGLMPALLNVLVIGFAAVAALMGTGAIVSATLLAAGVFCGGLIQWLVLLAAARRERHAELFPHADAAKEALRRLPAGIFGAAVPQICFVLAGVFASWQGDMSTLFYAERLLEFPLGVLGAAVGMAAVPELRDQANDSSHAVTVRVLEWTLALHVAAGAGLAAVSGPLVALLYGHGAFDAAAVARTAYCLQIYALALPAYAASRPLLAACHLHGLSGVVNGAAAGGLAACGLTGCLSLFVQSRPTFVTAVPALSVVAGLTVLALWLWLALYRRIGLRLPVRRVAVNIPAGLAVYYTATAVLDAVPGAIGLGLAIVAGVSVWGACFGLLRKSLF